MISVKNLTKIYKSPVKTDNIFKNLFNREYKEHKALDHISFEIGENELIGFIGPNGAGKTTTMKTLAGILYPTSGEVNVLGYNPFDKKNEFLRQIGFIMGQKNQLLWELPAIDSYNLNKEIYEIPEKAYKTMLNDLVELLEAKEFVQRPVKTLSLGQRMRAELIGALLHKPKVLFLDEPTIGLDIFAQTTITKFIKEYQERYKSTIILTSHYMQDVQRLAKRVLLIDHGHIIFDGQLSELVEKYSQEKTLNISLTEKIQMKNLNLPKDITIHYDFPQLKLTMPKDMLTDVLTNVLKNIEYGDVTIENEQLEEVIKKSFGKSATR